MSNRNRYYLSIDDIRRAHGADPALAWQGASPTDLAAALQEALRGSGLFERWRAQQPDPDDVDMGLAATDPQASASARVSDLHVDLDLVTDLPMRVVRQRLDWLIGSSWKLRDMRAA
ncbi:MAG: hypothetical protein HOQ10_00650 [Frateuria sp.]|uniref:hypothetical protein n=1 Tax=Frateuria sp. TaxID=2211372 RepID=UPI001806E3DD|nr:hypothetical protein [Frateuria sp.]NUO71212.1 hypothetical protein [Frateuria sp.]NUR23961.1 hypothetical protein [Frateuria sp.]